MSVEAGHIDLSFRRVCLGIRKEGDNNEPVSGLSKLAKLFTRCALPKQTQQARLSVVVP